MDNVIANEKMSGLKRRVILKIGVNHIAVNLSDIIAFFYDTKIVFSITKDGLKYISDQTLSQLENELSQHIFFRVNRKCIINGHHIKSFKSFTKTRLIVEMEFLSKEYTVIVSQKRASSFKKWVYKL